MAKTSVGLKLEQEELEAVDEFVKESPVFENRSQFIRTAVRKELGRSGDFARAE